MTPMQWFAFVILPGCLAVIAFATARLFERTHPIPVKADTPEADPSDARSTGFSEARGDYTIETSDRKKTPSA
jgi:hypothetical protein